MSREYVSVSVVIPCFNAAKTIERAIDSVAEQTKLPREVIVVDDLSEDDTLLILEMLKQKYPNGWLKIVKSTTNSGPASARNIGWNLAICDYIAFLDADDSWHVNKLEVQYSFMVNNQNVVLSCHETAVKNDKDSFQGMYSANEFNVSKLNFQAMLMSNAIPTRSVMLKRSISFRFEEGKRYAEDYLLWLEIINIHPDVYKSDLCLAFSFKEELSPDGLTGNVFKMHAGVIDTYRNLYDRGFFGRVVYYRCLFISYIKFFKRIFVKFLFVKG